MLVNSWLELLLLLIAADAMIITCALLIYSSHVVYRFAARRFRKHKLRG